MVELGPNPKSGIRAEMIRFEKRESHCEAGIDEWLGSMLLHVTALKTDSVGYYEETIMKGFFFLITTHDMDVNIPGRSCR